MIHVLSADQENDADVLAVVGASASLVMSKIPFRTPIAAVRVGRIQGAWILNPTFQQLEFSDVDFVVAGTENAIQMVEGGAVEISEDDVVAALEVAHVGIKELIGLERELIEGLQQPEMEWTPVSATAELRTRVVDVIGDRIETIMAIGDKAERGAALSELRQEVMESLADDFEDQEGQIRELLYEGEKSAMRRMILDKSVRSDGRGLDEVRPITCETSLLPRTHGSSLFTRGQTQALGVVTLGTEQDEQRIDSIDVQGETKKSFMLHYNFPPFSTGEAKPLRGTSRREQGHGALAERAIQPLLPPYDDFPYTIRIVSEVLESNGSSSMASVCAASLALRDAGVPIQASIAGVAMGLIKEGEKVAILTDILGVEDALGDMDFKVAGTRKGVTSIQMDIKSEGLSVQLMRDALERALVGRLHILDRMDEAMPTHRAELAKWAPRIITIQINPEKIGDIIGPKGKTIRAIQEDTGAQINIEDSGIVKIASVSGEGGERARQRIMEMTQEPEIGTVYEGVVKSTTSFGAFIEIIPGVEALCHISELANGRTERTEDVVKKGDVTRVKLISIDDKGRLRLSRKALLTEEGPAGGE
jgi:polyribonucleotide nucleotidyltransferase